MFGTHTFGAIPTTYHIDDKIDILLSKAKSLSSKVTRNKTLKSKLEKTEFDIRNIKIGICLEIPKNRSTIMESLERHELTLCMIETQSTRW